MSSGITDPRQPRDKVRGTTLNIGKDTPHMTGLLPTAKLDLKFDAELVGELKALHKRAELSYPNPPAPDLLAEIDEREEVLNADANRQILAKGAELRAAGERPWFEVWYPYDSQVDPDGDGTSTFWDRTGDAVEVLADGTIMPLPPYSELAKAGA